MDAYHDHGVYAKRAVRSELIQPLTDDMVKPILYEIAGGVAYDIGHFLSPGSKRCISRNKDKSRTTRRGEACHSTFSDLSVKLSVAVSVLHVILPKELTTGAVTAAGHVEPSKTSANF